MSDWNSEVNAIFSKAIEADSRQEIDRLLDTVCQHRPELREQVESLLRAHDDPQSLSEHIPKELFPGDIPSHAGACGPAAEIDLGFLTPSEDPETLGTLGKYEILELLGRGGMGMVFRARDLKLDRIVAVKVLIPELASSSSARQRFLREAQAAAAVSHDHVVTIFAVEDEAALPFLAMECVEGLTLGDKLDREGHLELREILRIGTQAAAGLAAAHQQGLVHRDIKPANILLENGVQRVKITDFGLARAMDDGLMTRSGMVVGTPQFMSPEQVRGERVDGRSDLFSLGCVLYAMCVGHAPFRADSVLGILKRVCEDSPRTIQELNPDVPDWLAVIIQRLMEKDRELRYQSAEEVRQLFETCLAHVQNPQERSLPKALNESNRLPAVGARSIRSLRRWGLAAAILVALCGLFGTSEATGVTNLTATVIRLAIGEGTLVIEKTDPDVQITIDGETVRIRGAGVEELKLTPGQYRVAAMKDGRSLKQELVTITRGGRQLVSVSVDSSPKIEGFGIVDRTSIAELLADDVGATLIVEVEDPDVQLIINGEDWAAAGKGPQELKVRPGRYRFLGLKNGVCEFDQAITLRAGERRALRFHLSAQYAVESGIDGDKQRDAYEPSEFFAAWDRIDKILSESLGGGLAVNVVGRFSSSDAGPVPRRDRGIRVRIDGPDGAVTDFLKNVRSGLEALATSKGSRLGDASEGEGDNRLLGFGFQYATDAVEGNVAAHLELIQPVRNKPGQSTQHLVMKIEEHPIKASNN